MDRDNPELALYKEPEQEAVRRDLALLFGPNAEYYLEEYERMRQFWIAGAMPRPSWNWSAFLAGPAWMFYRKLYGFGSAIFALALVFEVFFGSFPSELVAGVVTAAASNAAYVQRSLRLIKKTNDAGLAEQKRDEHLRRVGGVSKCSGIGGLVLVLLLILASIALKRLH